MSVATKDYSMVVGGAWTESESGERFEATSPATGESLGTVPEGTREDARRAIAAANDARRDWAARARHFFHSEINNGLYAQYIVEASLLQPFSHDYVWARDIHLDGSRK